jgi:hypothetical protein
MARTNPTFTRTALEEYTALKPHQKRLCWLFYRSLQTHFKEGLDPRPEKVPGSINNWKASGTVKDYIAQRNFRYNANVSCFNNRSWLISYCCVHIIFSHLLSFCFCLERCKNRNHITHGRFQFSRAIS